MLSGKDGLALISANGVSVGHAALVVARAERVADAADIAAALSMEATAANPSILHPAVARAKPIPGQAAAAEHLRALLEGSELLQPGAARSVQDALSFRVVPQVHGALREYVAAARDCRDGRAERRRGQPAGFRAGPELISNGNFHPMVLAIACDALRIALAQVGQLSERRMSHLWDGCMRQITGPAEGNMYGLHLRYPAAALFPELKQLAAPATLDTPPLDLGVEDHAHRRSAERPQDRHRTRHARGPAGDRADARPTTCWRQPRTSHVLGAGTEAALGMVEEAITEADPEPDAVHRAIRERFPVRPVGASAASGQSAAR